MMGPETKMIRVGIAGGAFDPPHNGHLMLASTALNCGVVDEVWFVPSGNRSDKTYCTPIEHRMQLLSLLLRDGVPVEEPRIRLCSLEVDEPRLVGTVELFRELRVRHPAATFSAIIGGDLVKALSRWRHAEALRREVPFIVIPRGGASAREDHPGFQLTWVASDIAISVSSTLLRALLAERKSVLGLMPRSLMEYIEKNGLYRQGQDESANASTR